MRGSLSRRLRRGRAGARVGSSRSDGLRAMLPAVRLYEGSRSWLAGWRVLILGSHWHVGRAVQSPTCASFVSIGESYVEPNCKCGERAKQRGLPPAPACKVADALHFGGRVL